MSVSSNQIYPNKSFNGSHDEEKSHQRVINNQPELKGVIENTHKMIKNFRFLIFYLILENDTISYI